MRRILQHSRFVQNSVKTLKINTLIDEYAKGNSDFNDQVIAEICKREKLKLVTHDSDFKGKGIDVLTANKKLIGRRNAPPT